MTCFVESVASHLSSGDTMVIMQRTTHQFVLALTFLYILGVTALAVQPLMTLVASGYQGVYFKGGDESQYIMRVQDAMQSPWTDVSNAITSGTDAPRGLQMTFFETTAGSLFAWTGFSATALTVLFSVFLAPLSMVFLSLLAVRLGVRRRTALLASLLYFFLLFGPLRRVIHQSWSLPFVLGTLLLMVSWWKESTRTKTVVLGVLLGFSPGIYFWAWTYLWAVFGLLSLLTVVMRYAHRETRVARTLLFDSVATGCIALVIALPFFVLLWLNAEHPFSDATSIRSSLLHAREFESIPRSIVLGLLTICTILWARRLFDWKRTIPLLSFVLGLFAVLHQQFVHGLVLSFWTHYYPYVCAVSALLIAVIFSQSKKSMIDYCVIGLSCLFLLGAFHDYKGRGTFRLPLPEYSRYQHLSGLIETLRLDEHTETILTDRDTSLMIGNATKHDLVFTSYLRHILVSDRELAERYCLVEAFKKSSPDTEWLAHDVQELSAAGQDATKNVLEQGLALTQDACAWVTAHKKEALKKYGVSLLAWDERNHPEWRIDEKLFQSVSKGAGWSLWSLR